MIDAALNWWKGGLSPWVKLVYLVLIANGLPAFIILMSLPGQTANWFVWTVNPQASAHLLGVMYGNALLLVVFGIMQPSWVRARITLLVISIFSVVATIVTLFNLGPFLQHPWFHLGYWLSMYCILFFLAPVVFYVQERAHGGRLPVEVALSPWARTVAAASMVVLALAGLALFIGPPFANNFWPWSLTPLVSRIVAVWLSTLAIAYCWALWDGDWLRTRPIFWQAIPTGAALALIPLVHSGDLQANAALTLGFYLAFTAGLAALNLVVVLVEQRISRPALSGGAS
jgi:hypothetical protein